MFFRGTPVAVPAEIMALRGGARRVMDVITLQRGRGRHGGACASCAAHM